MILHTFPDIYHLNFYKWICLKLFKHSYKIATRTMEPLAAIIKKVFFLGYIYRMIFYIWGKVRGTPKAQDFIYNLEECPICFDLFREPIRIQCGHVYCLRCLALYCREDTRNKCPMCREFIRKIFWLEGYTTKKLSARENKKLLGKLQLCLRRNNSYLHIFIWYMRKFINYNTAYLFLVGIMYAILDEVKDAIFDYYNIDSYIPSLDLFEWDVGSHQDESSFYSRIWGAN